MVADDNITSETDNILNGNHSDTDMEIPFASSNLYYVVIIGRV